MPKTVGVLALQGDFREHQLVLSEIGARNIQVRTIEDLRSIDALVIPGGESTTMQNLATAFGLFEPLKSAIAEGLPTFGTCAGLIMLANTIIDGVAGQRGFGGLDVEVRRNAFGNQLDSFEADLNIRGIEEPVHAAFIRAPIVVSAGPSVDVLCRLDDGQIVAVQQGNILGISFHPEVTGETRVHEYFMRFLK
jgi:5'-phosphate synthase pdxT subunit